MSTIVRGLIVLFFYIEIMKTSNKNEYLVKLGLRIREERKLKGYSQESLALEAGIDRSYLGGVERGERNLSLLTLLKICDCLSCDIAKLTKGLPND